MNIDIAIGKELDDLAKEVQLSRYMILDYEILLLTDQELRILVKNKYEIIDICKKIKEENKIKKTENIIKTEDVYSANIAFKKENQEFWEKDAKRRREIYQKEFPKEYENLTCTDQFLGKPLIDRRNGKDKIIGKVIKVEDDGRFTFELDKNIKLEDIDK